MKVKQIKARTMFGPATLTCVRKDGQPAEWWVQVDQPGWSESGPWLARDIRSYWGDWSRPERGIN